MTYSFQGPNRTGQHLSVHLVDGGGEVIDSTGTGKETSAGFSEDNILSGH